MVTQEELEQMSPEEIAELQKQHCPFCKIVKGEIPSRKVYEDENILAILDIHPGVKGHILVLPKEHIPILPLVPPPLFTALFATTQLLAQAVKKALRAKGVAVFIANGAVAGQQSPHFLFHILPRDDGDALSCFTLHGQELLSAQQEEIASSLSHNLTLMMHNHAKRQGRQQVSSANKLKATQSTATPSTTTLTDETSPLVTLTPEMMQEAKKDHIAKLLQENPDVRHLLTSNPADFKTLIKENEQVEELFRGVDIDALSEKLNTMDAILPSDSLISLPQSKSSSTSSFPEKRVSSQEVFLGANAKQQEANVFTYFAQKPKAKELFLSDIATFQELLRERVDIQPIFQDVVLEKLQRYMEQQEVTHLD